MPDISDMSMCKVRGTVKCHTSLTEVCERDIL